MMLVAVCSNRPRASTGARGNGWWKRDVYHLAHSGERTTLCGCDSADWLTIGAAESIDNRRDCCARCARTETEMAKILAAPATWPQSMSHVVMCKAPGRAFFEPIAAFNCDVAAQEYRRECVKAKKSDWAYEVRPSPSECIALVTLAKPIVAELRLGAPIERHTYRVLMLDEHEAVVARGDGRETTIPLTPNPLQTHEERHAMALQLAEHIAEEYWQ